GVPFDGRCGEAGQVGVGERRRPFEHIREAAESGAEDEADGRPCRRQGCAHGGGGVVGGLAHVQRAIYRGTAALAARGHRAMVLAPTPPCRTSSTRSSTFSASCCCSPRWAGSCCSPG